MRTSRLERLILRAYPEWFRARHGPELLSFWRLSAGEPRYRGARGRLRRGTHVLREMTVGLRLRIRPAPDGAPIGRFATSDGVVRTIRRELALAARTVGRAPTFAIAVILTLALGIGATSAMFSVVESVLLRPLPYADADRLATVTRTVTTGSSEIAWPDYRDWKDRSTTFAAVAAYAEAGDNFEWPDGAELVRGALVTRNLFDVMGAVPMLGRLFSADEDRFGGTQALILSHGLWWRRFGGDSAVLGRRIPLGGDMVPIVGVMPPGFNFPYADGEYWAPLREEQLLADVGLRTGSRTLAFLNVVGRLAEGATMMQAEEELTRIAQAADPERGGGEPTELAVLSLHDTVAGSASETLLFLMGAVMLVFIVACANVAGLAMSRAARRHSEMAVRAAIGASRGRLAGVLVAESVVLSVASGLVGVLVAAALLQGFRLVAPPGIPRLDEIGVAGSTLAAAGVLTLGAGLLFGLIPALLTAWHHTRPRVGLAPRAATAQGQRGQRLLVTAQVALAVVLLAGAALLANSFARLMRVDAGFDTSGVMIAAIAPPDDTYDTAERVSAFYATLLERVRALPGVAHATTSYSPPLADNEFRMSIAREGDDEGAGPDADPRIWAGTVIIGDDYFATTGTRLLSGKAFGPEDRLGAEPVAVVSRTMARRLWPGQDPVGKRFRSTGGIGGSADSFDPKFFPTSWYTVVGVAGDVRRADLAQTPAMEFYRPHAQIAWPFQYLLVRTSTRIDGLGATLQRTVWSVDRRVPVYSIRSMGAQVAASVAAPRFRMLLLIGFAGLASVLVVVGIYGVTALSVARREREIGIRMALGAGSGRVLGEVLRDGLGFAITGLTIGLVVAALLGRGLASMLFEVGPTDPVTFLVVGVVTVGVALLATYVPARRASRLDPAQTLRPN